MPPVHQLRRLLLVHPVDGVPARRNLRLKQEAAASSERGVRHLGVGVDPLVGNLSLIHI